ncbi:TPA: hypothetical protein IAA92_01145 [Candidatus Galligastranaerophilus intestinigallinarum]|nr:hypothetical protein [Candidatus Galligastranaerophilus intestinigallinarum]
MQVDTAKLENIPKNSYLVVHKDLDNEDHIIKKRPTTGARIVADKFVNDVFSYAPKGMTGSKNSNFYEFLSLGLIPNLVGSASLILISNALNNKFGGRDSLFANMNGRKMAAGVVLYAAGKWLGNKIINKGVKATTGVDMEMPYKKIVHELPDYKGDPDTTSVEFHRVFESTDFPRWDLINKQGEHNNNRYEYYDKMAKKMGYTQELNASDQVVQPKIKEVLVKSTAAKSISSFVWAALGVAIAAQKPFEEFMNFRQKPTFTQAVKELPKQVAVTMKESVKSLAKTKMGKGLMIGAAATSILGIWNASKNFKAPKENKKSTVDYNKSYMEF